MKKSTIRISDFQSDRSSLSSVDEKSKNTIQRVNTESFSIYADYLIRFSNAFKVCMPYLQIGNCRNFEGWALHVSIVVPLIPEFLLSFLPFTIDAGIPFEIPYDRQNHYSLLTQKYDLWPHRAMINIYPPDELTARNIAVKLIDFTADYAGPVIPWAIPLGNRVYTSFMRPNGKAKDGNSTADDKQSTWPFYPIRSPKKKKTITSYNGYILDRLIKNDPKGNVYKCFKVGWALKQSYFILKQGFFAQSYDEHHRDIRERLLWQARVHEQLANHLPIPRCIEYFHENNDAYLVLQHINGLTLTDFVTMIYKGALIYDVTESDRVRIQNIALEIVDIVIRLHEFNYLHRDLNPQNFILTNEDKLILIDFELSVSLTSDEPFPPFGIGTPGYMSPNQFRQSAPTFQDDYFGLGGLLIKLYTGISPLKFENNKPEILESQLTFFTGDHALSALLAKMRSTENSLADLKLLIQSLKGAINRSTFLGIPQYGTTRQNIVRTIYKGLQIYQTGLFNLLQDPELIRSQNFGEGSCGILYLLAIAQTADILNAELSKFSGRLFSALNQYYIPHFETSNDTLLHGNCGIAVSFAKMLQAGLIGADYAESQTLQLLIMADDPITDDLANGKAGSGVSILKTITYLQPTFACKLLDEYVSYFVNAQKEDGSWLLPDLRQHEELSLFWGMPGITYFLMSYHSLFPAERVERAIRQNINFLTRHPSFPTNAAKPGATGTTSDFAMCSGRAGLVLMFLRAYQLFGDKTYRDTTRTLLASFPKFPNKEYLGFANGLAGFGELYLEAYKILGDEEWQKRADDIALFLIHTGSTYDPNSIYWLPVKEPNCIPDFLHGQAGILHFLLRYLKPDLIQFPII